MEDKSPELESLLAEEAELEKRLAELRERRTKIERSSRPARKTGRPLRDLVLDMLQEAGFPLNSLLLSSLIRPIYGRSVASTRFGTLANDEGKSYDSKRVRPVYLCHCLTYDHGQAVKRFWARSDWSLANRIIGPMGGRVLFLRGAAWTVDLAMRSEKGLMKVEDLETLNYVAADQARDAGLLVERGKFPHAEWLAGLHEAIDKFAPEDEVLREESAKAVAKSLSERELLFGAQAGLVSLPGTKHSWRSVVGDD